MKILALEHEQPGLSSQDFAPHLKAEAAGVYEYYKQGIIREIYFRHDQSSAVLILECDSVAEAKSYLDELPLVKHGLINFEIIPLIAYPGFERLFSKQ